MNKIVRGDRAAACIAESRFHSILNGGVVGLCLALAAARAPAQVVISEIMYDPLGGETNEFVELHNAGTNDAALGGWFFADGITYTFASPTTLRTGAYLVVAADRAAFAARYPAVSNLAAGVYAGQLSNQGERLALSDAASNVIFDVTYNNKDPWPTAAAGLGSSLVLMDAFAPATNPANWVASAYLNGSPGASDAFLVRDVVINEVLAHTDPPQEDAVELRNLTTNAVNIGGWYLSDDAAVRKKYQFPTNTIVPPLGYAVVYQYQTYSNNLLVPFSLSSKGDDLYLSEANSSGEIVRYVDQLVYDASRNGISFGRYPDGTGEFLTLAEPTFGVSNPSSLEQFRTGTGARNAGPKVGPVVINEIMYHPLVSNGLGRMAAEYIEILNISPTNVPLYNPEYPEYTWSLTGGISYDFPSNLTLHPGQFLLIVETNDVEGFRQSYGLSNSVVILGPWSNSLNNAGDTVRLRAPNSPELFTNIAARFVVDEVKYNDKLPWPLAADGMGGSLQRIDAAAYGNTAENWHSAPNVATPGTTNTPYVPAGSIVISEVMAVNRHTLQDEEGDYSDWFELYNTRSYDIPLGGWYVTDKASMPTQWTFPPVTIPAHGYLVVFADMKNLTNDVTHLHTNFALDEAGEFLGLFRPDLACEFAFDPAYPPQSTDVSYGFEQFGNRQEIPVKQGSRGRYLVPTNAAALAGNWMDRTFNEAGWSAATNGLGYDTATTYLSLIATDLKSQVYNQQRSTFVRFPFVVSNSADVAQIVMRLKFEDGFIAWLNGVVVASNNAPANAAWNSLSSADRADSLALVFQNYDLSGQIFRLVDGTNVLAFQLMNSSTSSSDLLLLPELQLTWGGGSTGTTGVAQGYLQSPSPGGFNAAGLPGVAPTPALSHPGGVFGGELAVTVTCVRVDAELHYTLDGSTPTTNSPLYTVPLAFSSNTELMVRAFLPGLVPSPAIGAVYRKSFLGINEILASNATTTPEINDFGGFSDWIELFNAGTNTIDLSGYHLSDNLDQPFRWRIPDGAAIPAGGYFLVWADGVDSKPGLIMTRTFWPYWGFTTRYYHASFKLSAVGESVGLFSPSGSRVDAVNYGFQAVDISYGRYPDGGTNWGYFGEATAATNNRAPLLTQNFYRAPAVTISPTNDILSYTGAVQVVLTTDPSASAIRYTTNGAMPTSSSLLYTQSITLATSGVIRARSFATNLPPGPVATRTFLRNARTPDLPIISLVVDPKLLNDPVVGIYTNVLKEREVPVNIQYCTTLTNTGFQIDAGLRIFGLNTFMYAQKPFTIYLNAKYGPDGLAYQLFQDKPIGSFDRFVLRNGNDDWAKAYLRDTLGQTIMKGVIDNATQGYTPCAAYLNGAYYGLINIQEKMDEMYCVKNYGVDPANIDFFEMDGTATTDDWLLDAGTADGWNSLVAFISTNSLADPANFAYVKSQVDIEDMIDYVAAQTYAIDTSWFHNRKWWRDRNPGGKWRWCIVDMDYVMQTGNINNNQFSTMATGSREMLVFHECMSNTEFRTYCAQRVMAHLNGSFSTNRTLPIIDREAARIRNELIPHIALYGSKGGISSLSAWDTQIEGIRDFARRRPAIAMGQVANFFGATTARVAVATSGGSGRVLANYVALNPGATNAFLAGLPMTLTAQPAIGQTFVRWEVTSNAPATLIAANSTWRYRDTVTNEIAGWASTNYNDAAWPSGPGQLGYGDGDESTTIGYGPDATNKYITYYFRGRVNIPNPAAYTNFQLGLLRDDGVVMYVNGREVLRDNMPTGVVTIATTALTNITSALGENDYNVFMLSPTNFVAGTNLLAFEIHNVATNNADLGFDLQMVGLGGRATSVLTNVAELTWTPVEGLAVTAVFAPSGVSLLPAVISSNTVLTAAGSPYYATGDIFVPSNTTLSAGPGVDILMPETADIRVQGHLQLIGSSNSPVRVLPNTNAGSAVRFYLNPAQTDTNDLKRRWGGISFESATHTGEFVNVVIRGASLLKHDPSRYLAAISSYDSSLWMEGLDIDDCQSPIVTWYNHLTVLKNSRVPIHVVGDCIKVTGESNVLLEGNEFYCPLALIDTDAIDFGKMTGGEVRGNLIHDFMGINSDSVDFGESCLNVIVESNYIYRVFDKAISIGGGTHVIFRHNVIRDCDKGAGIKDLGSYGLIEYNTYHKVTSAVEIYEKVFGRGGASADIRGCIFSECAGLPVWTDPLSTATVSYCLSDTLPVVGAGNIVAEPQFLNAANMDFRLQTGSAAVDAGPPGDPADADGSRADMGARAFDWREGHVAITEIHYHPADSNLAEFVELNNPGRAPLDLTGYSFAKGIDYTFPPGSVLNPGAYLVLASSTNVPGCSNVLVWTSGVLDNAGETLQLIDPASNEIDRVDYLSEDPWPVEPDGMGPSLALIDPRWDNSLPSNWYASGAIGGTPYRPFDHQLTGTFTIQRGGTGGGIGSGGSLHLSVGGLAGLLYTLEFTPTLMPSDWHAVGSDVWAVAGQVQFDHVPGTSNGFYRVRSHAP